MANTVHGPFQAINVVNGSTPANATWGNNAQTQASVALNGLNGDVWSSHVLSGVTPSIDGTLANQLDIASGIVYLRMNDNSIARCDVAATTFTTSTPSTTYYLDLNPDGSWSWGTAHSGVANHQLIAQCTTDGSGNIATLTDNRGPSGMPGVPYVVARALHVHVTTTAVQTVLDYTSFVPGLYRVSSYANILNGTSGQHTSWGVTWWDSDNGLVPGSNNFCSTHSNGPLLVFDGLTTTINNGVYSGNPMLIEATSASGHHITVSYTANGGTPNDYISSIVERIA